MSDSKNPTGKETQGGKEAQSEYYTPTAREQEDWSWKTKWALEPAGPKPDEPAKKFLKIRGAIVADIAGVSMKFPEPVHDAPPPNAAVEVGSRSPSLIFDKEQFIFSVGKKGKIEVYSQYLHYDPKTPKEKAKPAEPPPEEPSGAYELVGGKELHDRVTAIVDAQESAKAGTKEGDAESKKDQEKKSAAQKQYDKQLKTATEFLKNEEEVDQIKGTQQEINDKFDKRQQELLQKLYNRKKEDGLISFADNISSVIPELEEALTAAAARIRADGWFSESEAKSLRDFMEKVDPALKKANVPYMAEIKAKVESMRGSKLADIEEELNKIEFKLLPESITTLVEAANKIGVKPEDVPAEESGQQAAPAQTPPAATGKSKPVGKGPGK